MNRVLSWQHAVGRLTFSHAKRFHGKVAYREICVVRHDSPRHAKRCSEFIMKLTTPDIGRSMLLHPTQGASVPSSTSISKHRPCYTTTPPRYHLHIGKYYHNATSGTDRKRDVTGNIPLASVPSPTSPGNKQGRVKCCQSLLHLGQCGDRHSRQIHSLSECRLVICVFVNHVVMVR